MAKSAMIGVNGTEVAAALAAIEETYKSIINEGNRLQPRFIDKVGISWYGQDAIEYMSRLFDPSLKDFYDNTNRIYQSIFDTIIQNVRNFERKHQVTILGNVSHTPQKVDYYYNSVRKDKNGFIGLSDLVQLKDACYCLKGFRQSVEKDLETAKKAAAASGFYGENQQERLNESMSTIRNNLGSTVEQLTGKLEKMIQTVEEAERNIARSNANAM